MLLLGAYKYPLCRESPVKGAPVPSLCQGSSSSESLSRELFVKGAPVPSLCQGSSLSMELFVKGAPVLSLCQGSSSSEFVSRELFVKGTLCQGSSSFESLSREFQFRVCVKVALRQGNISVKIFESSKRQSKFPTWTHRAVSL